MLNVAANVPCGVGVSKCSMWYRLHEMFCEVQVKLMFFVLQMTGNVLCDQYTAGCRCIPVTNVSLLVCVRVGSLQYTS